MAKFEKIEASELIEEHVPVVAPELFSPNGAVNPQNLVLKFLRKADGSYLSYDSIKDGIHSMLSKSYVDVDSILAEASRQPACDRSYYEMLAGISIAHNALLSRVESMRMRKPERSSYAMCVEFKDIRLEIFVPDRVPTHLTVTNPHTGEHIVLAQAMAHICLSNCVNVEQLVQQFSRLIAPKLYTPEQARKMTASLNKSPRGYENISVEDVSAMAMALLLGFGVDMQNMNAYALLDVIRKNLRDAFTTYFDYQRRLHNGPRSEQPPAKKARGNSDSHEESGAT
ncbi:hypothetical protein Y032_0128g1463 [Ancylostoma ceylanicum]|uniref:Uncharacterized protein n=1 Tax=Ancylostoma ceylanicum TaxID=53326 RepID=A0A016T7Y2_9BILA|nr:hypothetical protein Y032_0128g1463 [Ancylostoma ceylanicum]